MGSTVGCFGQRHGCGAVCEPLAGCQRGALMALARMAHLNLIRGLVGTPFSREKCGAPRFAHVPLTLAHLPLFHRRLDGHMRTSRAHVPVKTAMKKEQIPSVRSDRRKTRCCARTVHEKKEFLPDPLLLYIYLLILSTVYSVQP